MIKGLLCHLRIIVFVVVYALGAYAPFDQHFADAQGVSPGSGGSPGQNVCPQCPASGTGDASCCCCLEQHIRNYDGGNVPNWFLDADPLDGAREPRDYEIKELTGSDLENAEIDPNESELTGVVDAWDMTPQEIFEAEYAKLKTLGEQWLVDRIIDSNGPPAAIPKVGYGYRNNTDYPIYSDLKERGLLQYVDTDYYQFQEYGGPSIVWYGLKLRNSMCFYSCSYAYSSTEQSDGWMCQSSPRLWKCISNKWMTTLTTPSERLREARSAHGNEAIEMGVFVLDFAVGMTPFLGTADQVAQDWDKLKELDPAAVGMCLGGAAGDVVIVGKLSQLIKGANAASKFGKAVTVTSYAAGAGSVAAGATSLYLQNRGDWKEGSTWGRAAFFGIQAIGLITDRDAHRIIAPHIKRIALKAKMPQAWAACKNGCKGLKEKVKLFGRDDSGNLNLQPLSEVKVAVTTCCEKVEPADYLPDWHTHTQGQISPAYPKAPDNGSLRDGTPWPRLKNGGHVKEKMQTWLDEILSSSFSIRDRFLTHLGVPGNVKASIKNYADLRRWCNSASSSMCGIHPNGVEYMVYPRELMSGKAFENTEMAALSIGASDRNFAGYKAGGKTQFPADGTWTEDKIRKATDLILAPGNGKVVKCDKGGKIVVGDYEGVRIAVQLNGYQELKVQSVFPTWSQNLNAPL